MATQTEILLDELNALKGVVNPQKGFSYFANVKGDGSRRRSVYTIVSDDGTGGLIYSWMNDKNSVKRLANIKLAITRQHQFNERQTNA